MVSSNISSVSWILLDTNFLIDFYSKQQLYVSLLEELREAENSIVSIKLVRCEFLRAKTRDVVKLKSDFFNKIVENILPLDKEVYKLVQPTIEQYGNDLEKVSLADIYLGCVIQRYAKVYLLTRNHQDFPTRLFSRVALFNIELPRDVKTYGLYQYKKAGAQEISAEIESVPF